MNEYTEVDAIYDAVIDADVQGRGSSIQQNGEFIVENQQIHIQKSMQGLGLLWIIEFKIISSNVDEIKPGATKSVAYKPQQRPLIDPGNIKAHIAASYGAYPKDIQATTLSKDSLRAITGEQQVLFGHQLCLSTEVLTAKSGREYTRHTWSPLLPGQVTKADAAI